VEKKRVVIAGQVPPPIGGQAIMIARILDELHKQSVFEVVHLPFFFTKDVRRMRRAGFDKILEVFAVLGRLARIRATGAIDAMLYPVGGPQLVPLVRDVCLLPWALLASKKVIFHFHAAGIAETIGQYPFFLRALVRFLYRKADAAIVMTEFGKRDAECFGIRNVVVPHTLEDTYDPGTVSRSAEPATLLYVGHLAREKGTPSLLEAFATLRRTGAGCVLELVGECLPSYSEEAMKAAIQRLEIQNSVRLCGVLSGKAKWERFARANLFVFPSVAPESFGLVMAEAMMWALPIIACDWRGNREVLGEAAAAGGIVFAPGPDLTAALTDALQKAFAQRERWVEWGIRNRKTFERQYKAECFSTRFPDALKSLVQD
jgi:glycosyltransferase involved in cell wall biosynthesis